MTSGAARRRDARTAILLSHGLAATVPACLIVGFSFRSGGYPPGLAASGAALLGVLFAARTLLWPATMRPLASPAAVLAAALGAMALWALASTSWSGTPSLAIEEASRTSLYLMAFLTMATLPRATLSPAVRSVAAAITIVALVALATRVAPDVVPIHSTAAQPRLSYPLSYQNALGLLIACGLILLLHLASHVRETRAVKVLATACVPAVTTALYLSQSRGAIGAALVGVVLWAILGRPRSALLAFAALALPVPLAVGMAYRSVGLIGYQWNIGESVGQGHRLAVVVAVACVLAGWLRARLLTVDDVTTALPRPSRQTIVVGALVSAVLMLAVGVATGLPERVRAAATSFKSDVPLEPVNDPRARLTQAFNGGRLDLWRAAGEAWREHPLGGAGAGTFEQSWSNRRPRPDELTEAHSLYFETLSELGVIGLALLVVALIALSACLWTARAPRATRGALLAVAGTWMLHVAVDWDWEMPAVTTPLFLLAGAASWRRRDRPAPRPRLTAGLAMAVLAVSVLPAAWAAGQALEDHALEAYASGDCGTAGTRARQALTVMPWRPDAEVVRAACLARAGDGHEAVIAVQRAVELAPHDWRYAYDAAMVLASTAADGEPEARRAAKLSRFAAEPAWAFRRLHDPSTGDSARVPALGPLMVAGDRYPPVLSMAAVAGS